MIISVTVPLVNCDPAILAQIGCTSGQPLHQEMGQYGGIRLQRCMGALPGKPHSICCRQYHPAIARPFKRILGDNFIATADPLPIKSPTVAAIQDQDNTAGETSVHLTSNEVRRKCRMAQQVRVGVFGSQVEHTIFIQHSMAGKEKQKKIAAFFIHEKPANGSAYHSLCLVEQGLNRVKTTNQGVAQHTRQMFKILCRRGQILNPIIIIAACTNQQRHPLRHTLLRSISWTASLPARVIHPRIASYPM